MRRHRVPFVICADEEIEMPDEGSRVQGPTVVITQCWKPGLRDTGMHFLTVLEAGSLGPGVSRAELPRKGLKGPDPGSLGSWSFGGILGPPQPGPNPGASLGDILPVGAPVSTFLLFKGSPVTTG